MRPARPARRPDDTRADPQTGKDKPAPTAKRKKKKRRRRRSPVLMIVLLALLLPLLHGGYWVYTGRLLRDSLEGWIAQQRAQGIAVTHAPIVLSGFPLAVTATVADISMQAGPDRGGWSWSTPLIRLKIAPWRPAEVHVALDEAPHSLTLPQNGTPLRLTGQAAEAEVVMTLDFSDEPPRTIRATVRDALIESPAWQTETAALTALDVDYARPGLFEGGADAPTHTVRATLTSLRLPSVVRGPFAPEITDARLEAAVLGPLKTDRPMEDALRDWRNEDGRLLLDRLTVNWAPLALDSSGSLVLDSAMQPEGAISARISGFMTAIDSLAAQGLIRGRDATMAKVLLSTMASPNPGGEPVLDLPVVVRNGAVWAGPIALMPLPRLPWGPPPGSLGAAGVRPGFEIDRDGRMIPNE